MRFIYYSNRLLIIVSLFFLQACSKRDMDVAIDTAAICGVALPVCIWESIKSRPTPDPECKKEPLTVLPSQVNTNSIAMQNWRALSWLEPNSRIYPKLDGQVPFDFEYLAPILTKSGFESIQLKVPALTDRVFYGNSPNLLHELIGDATGVSWLKLSIQLKGHAACSAFEIAIEKNRRWLPDSLRKSGISDDQCIAVEFISAPQSSFEFDVIQLENTPDAIRERWLIRDTRRNSIYAEIVRHTKVGIDCPLTPTRQEFSKIVRPKA